MNIVRGIPYNARKRRCFIPLSCLVEQNLSQQDLFNGQFGNESCRHVVHQLCNRSYFHLKKSVQLFEAEKSVQSKSCRSLFLPMIVIDDYLKRIKMIDFDLTNKQIEGRNPWLIWNLWRQKYPRLSSLSSF